MSVTLKELVHGDGFARSCTYKENGTPASLAAVEVRAQARGSDGALVAELTVTKANQGTSPGVFVLSSPAEGYSTETWPVDTIAIDIEFRSGGVLRSTERILLPVVADVTRPA